MPDKTDPLADLVAQWRAIEPPPADAATDPLTLAAIEHMRDLWHRLPVPEVPRLVRRRTVRPGPIAAVAAVLLLAASWIGVAVIRRPTPVARPAERISARPVDESKSAASPQSASPAAPADGGASPIEMVVSECRLEKSVLRSGRVKLVMLGRPPAPADGENQ